MEFSLPPSIPKPTMPKQISFRWLCILLAAAGVAGCNAERQAGAGSPQIAADTMAPKVKTSAMPPLTSGWTKHESAFPNHPTWTFMPPGAMPNGKYALMVVLHGCNQTYNQFKQFGNLEEAAMKRGIVLAIPDVGSQHFGNDVQRCWDYDQAQDKHHNMDDVIGITEALAGSNNIDRGHIYIVGLSSGAAMALSIACKRPDLFAGVGSVAGPSVGSMQGMAFNGPMSLPPFNSPLPLPPLLDNVKNAVDTCKSLASKTGTANQFETQISSIAVGAMDKDSPTHQDKFPFQPPIDQPDCDHAGQVALVSEKWAPDNVEAWRRIYSAGDLGAEQSVQGGLATTRAAKKDGKERISFVMIKNVGHAWPAGKGTPQCTPADNPDSQGAGVWMAQKGLDYPEFITSWLMKNNARAGNPFAQAATSGQNLSGDSGSSK